MPYKDPEKQLAYNKAYYLKYDALPARRSTRAAAARERYAKKSLEERRKYYARGDKRVLRRRSFESGLRLLQLSSEDIARMFEAQDRRCAICPAPLLFDRKTHVDHCHRTGRVRGLLCESCNVSLGRLGENPNTMRKMADYIERHTGDSK